jgi:hypothetical protein
VTHAGSFATLIVAVATVSSYSIPCTGRPSMSCCEKADTMTMPCCRSFGLAATGNSTSVALPKGFAMSPSLASSVAGPAVYPTPKHCNLLRSVPHRPPVSVLRI